MCTDQLLEIYKVDYSVVGTLLSYFVSLNTQVLHYLSTLNYNMEVVLKF